MSAEPPSFLYHEKTTIHKQTAITVGRDKKCVNLKYFNTYI